MEVCVFLGNNNLSHFLNDLFIVSHLNSELQDLIFKRTVTAGVHRHLLILKGDIAKGKCRHPVSRIG